MPVIPEVVQLSLMHAKALDLMLYDNMMLMSGRWTTIRNRLQDKADEVAKEIYALQQSGKEVTQAWLNEHAYYRALAEQADNAAGQYAGWSANYTQQQIIKAAKFSTDEATLIAGRLYDTTAMGYFKGLPQAQVESIQAITLRDAPLDKLFKSISPNHYDELTNSLMTGLSMGMPMTEIAGLMMNVVDITYKRALLISRTEVNRAHRSATLRTYQQYEIPYYRRIASRGHACFACMMLDGMLYTSKEALDDHPNGACQMVPVLDPDSKSTDWEHGKERFEKMSEAEQRKIMGNNYFDAWKRGDFTLDQMVVVRQNPVWGGSPGVRPLKELSPNWRMYAPKRPVTEAEFRARAETMLRQMRGAEKAVTPLLVQSTSNSGGYMVGLENKFKTSESLTRKLQKEMQEQKVPLKSVRIGDSLRYTAVYNPENLVENYQQVSNELIQKGFTQSRCTNSFGSSGAYQGINTNWIDSKGHEFEIQFHTPESFRIKSANHLIYKNWRRLPDSSPEAIAMSQAMIDAWKVESYVVPNNYSAIASFDYP